LPLAIHQRDTSHTAYIAAVPFSSRIGGTLGWHLLGPYGPSTLRAVVLSLVVVVAMTLRLARWGSAPVKRNALLLAGIALTAFVLPLLIAPGSFRDRNLIVVLPPLLLIAGAAFVPRLTRPLAVVAGLAVAAVLLVPTVLAAHRLELQREDWRGMAKLIGPPSKTRAVVAYPRFEYLPLTHYRPDLRPVTSGGVRLSELVVVGRTQLSTLHFPHGFRRIEDKRLGTLRLLRLRAPSVRPVDVGALHLRPLLRLLHGFRSGVSGQDATLLVERRP
jgi:hypothetical protein